MPGLRLQKRPTAPCSIHPCPRCGGTKTFQPTTPSPAGTVFRPWYHAPKVPGRTVCPFVIALVELEGRTRLSVSCATSTIQGGDRNAGSGNVSTFRPVRMGPRGPCTRGAASIGAPSVSRRRQTAENWRCTAIPRSSSRPRSPPVTTRMSTTAGTRRGQSPGHLRQHPHRHRPRAALHHRLGPDPTPSSSRSVCRLRCAVVRHDTVTFSGEVTAIEDGLITVKGHRQQQPRRPRDRHLDADDRRNA